MTNVREHEVHPQGPPSETGARFNARRAMTWVEDAQRSLERAAELLAPIRGAGREHARIVQLRRAVGRAWPKIERLFQRRLDLVRGANVEPIGERIERTATGIAAIAGGAR